MEDHQYNTCKTDYKEEIKKNEKKNFRRKKAEEKDADSHLIELYKERSFLYNSEHKDFKNKTIRDNAWKEMSTIMQNYGQIYTPDYCQIRCTSLRTQFTREKRILDSQCDSENAILTHKPFAFYAQLSFLNNYVKRRRSRNSKTTISPASSFIPSSEIRNCDIDKVYNIDEKSNDTIYLENDSNYNIGKDRKNMLDDVLVTYKRTAEEDSNDSLANPLTYKKNKVETGIETENIVSLINKVISILNNKDKNEDEAFAQFIIAHLAKLSQSEKNTRKMMITDALFSPLKKI